MKTTTHFLRQLVEYAAFSAWSSKSPGYGYGDNFAIHDQLNKAIISSFKYKLEIPHYHYSKCNEINLELIGTHDIEII